MLMIGSYSPGQVGTETVNTLNAGTINVTNGATFGATLTVAGSIINMGQYNCQMGSGSNALIMQPGTTYSTAQNLSLTFNPIYNSAGSRTTTSQIKMSRTSTADGLFNGQIELMSRGASSVLGTALITNFLVDPNGSCVVGSTSLPTNAIDGFFYIPTCAGAPTGTPTAYAGRAPMIYDTSNNKFYVFNSAWKGASLI